MKITAGVMAEVQAILQGLDAIPDRLGHMLNGGRISLAEGDDAIGTVEWDQFLGQWTFRPEPGLEVFFVGRPATEAHTPKRGENPDEAFGAII